MVPMDTSAENRTQRRGCSRSLLLFSFFLALVFLACYYADCFRPLAQWLLNSQFQKRKLPLKAKIGFLAFSHSPLGLVTGQLRFIDGECKNVASAESLFVGPWDLELLRPELHLGRLLRLLRDKEVKKSKSAKGAKKEIKKAFWFPSRFAITDGRISATNTIKVTNLSTTFVFNDKGVMIDPFGAICRIKRAGVNPPPLIIGPIKGEIKITPEGCGQLQLSGASAHFADEEASSIEVDLLLCPDGRVSVNKIAGALPGGGLLKLSGSFSPLRNPPLEGKFALEEIGADRIPVSSTLIGNIKSGVAKLRGTYSGDPFVSPVDSQVNCFISVKEPTFTVIQGKKEKPLSLDELGATLRFSERKLHLDDMLINGFNGSLWGKATADFTDFPKMSWQSQLKFKKLDLGEIASFFAVDALKSGEATGDCDLTGSEDSFFGQLHLEKMSLQTNKEKELLKIALNSALCEMNFKRKNEIKLFLRRGELRLAKAKQSILIPEISTRVTKNANGLKMDFLHCRVGKEGVIKIKELLLPRSYDEKALVICSLQKVNTSLFDYLRLTKSLPKGQLDCSLFFSGVVKKLHEATIKANIDFAGEKDSPVNSAEGRFSIVDGKVTLKGARAKFKKGVGEAAGRGQFIDGEPTGRFTLALRDVAIEEKLPTVSATMSVDRREHKEPAKVQLELKTAPNYATHLKATGSLRNLMNWQQRFAGSTLTLEAFTLKEGSKQIEVPAGANLSIKGDKLLLAAPSVRAVDTTPLCTFSSMSLEADLNELKLLSSELNLQIAPQTTFTLSGQLQRKAGGVAISRFDVSSEKLAGIFAGQILSNACQLDFSLAAKDASSLGVMMKTTLPVDWQELKVKGRLLANEYELSAVNAKCLAEVKEMTYKAKPKLAIKRTRAKLSLQQNLFNAHDLKIELPGGQITLQGQKALGTNKWSVKLSGYFEKSDQFIKSFWAKGPLIDGPLKFKASARGYKETHTIDLQLEPLKILLEKKAKGRQLSIGPIKAKLKPREDSHRYNFDLLGKHLLYLGPELRRENGLSSLSLQGTWSRGLLSLTTSKLSFVDGGLLTLIGEVPLMAGVDGEFSYKLDKLNLASWDPTYMVSLDRGHLSLAGSFLGAWGDIADSIVEFDLSLADAEIVASGIKPGPFSLSSEVTYRKGSLALENIKANLLGGSMEGRGEGRWDRQSRLIELSTTFKELDLGKWVVINTPKGQTPPTVLGRINGKLMVKNRGELRAGFIGNGDLEVIGGQIKNVSTVVPTKGKKYLKRFQDLTFSKAKSKLFLIGDTLKMKEVELKANCGQMEGWLRLNRIDGKVYGKLYSILSKKLIPNRFAKSLASLFGGKYKNVGIVINGPATLPEFELILSPGRRKVFLNEKSH